MIVGLILAGCGAGAGAALAALVLGQGVWMALLIYSGTGVLGLLAGAGLVALRGPTGSCAVSRAHRG
jgi:hypothetical protein